MLIIFPLEHQVDNHGIGRWKLTETTNSTELGSEKRLQANRKHFSCKLLQGKTLNPIQAHEIGSFPYTYVSGT